ncbi:MAG: 7-cyano-7-deazaguanine synthase QueC [Pseudomonadota bacterium]
MTDLSSSLPPAVVLLSGGMDSATVLAIAHAEGYRPHTLSFRYGQRHGLELKAARRVVAHLGAACHQVLDIGLGQFGGSALTSDLAVPKGRSLADIGQGIPVTYVPARNTIFLALALGWAEVLEASCIYIGVSAVDYSGYPDCRPEFLTAFEQLAKLATRAGVEGQTPLTIRAPLIALRKAEIIQRGLQLGVDYGLTHSCYDPALDGRPCQACDACQLRQQGFVEAGLTDPLWLKYGLA